MSHQNISLQQWGKVLHFLRLPEMMYTCIQFRCSCKENQPVKDYLFSLERGGFFWYLNSDDEETSCSLSSSDGEDESPNSQIPLRTIHFCEEIEEVTASAVKEISCQTVLHELEQTLGQLKQRGCPVQERVVCERDDEDTSVYTRHLGFKVDTQIHFMPIMDVTWQCNSSGGKWCTFVSGFMSSSLLDKVVNAFLSGGNVSVQGEGGARRFTNPAFSWQYEHQLRFEITRTCGRCAFL
mgnify:CR=1 FL=1